MSTTTSTEIPVGFQACLLLFLSIVCLSTILGNGLVILSWIFHSPVRKPQNSYILSLSIADFLVGLFLVPCMMGEIGYSTWIFGATCCRLYILMALLLCTVSILHLVAISQDRYHIVFDTITYAQRRRFSYFLQRIVIIWMVAGWLIIPPMRDWEIIGARMEMQGLCIANTGKDLSISLAFGHFVLPISVISGTYWAICQELRQRTTLRQQSLGARSTISSSTSVNFTRRDSDRKALKMHGMIIAAFFFSWAPFAIGYAVIGFLPKDGKRYPVVQPILVAIGYANSAMNPIIYGLCNLNFREGFRKVVYFWRKGKD